MTLIELLDIVESRKKHFAYLMWRQSYLNGYAIWDGKNYPSTPEKALPELYPEKKPTLIKMPPNMQKKYIENLKKGFANGRK